MNYLCIQIFPQYLQHNLDELVFFFLFFSLAECFNKKGRGTTTPMFTELKKNGYQTKHLHSPFKEL